MPLKKILGSPGPPKSKPYLKMVLPQTHSFKRFVLVFSCFPRGLEEAGLVRNQVCWDSRLSVPASEATSVRVLSHARQAQV